MLIHINRIYLNQIIIIFSTTMKKRLLLVLLLANFLHLFSQNNDTFCEQLTTLNSIVEKLHYSPKPINDSLSLGVFKLFIKRIDKNTYLLTENDIKLFKKDSVKLDDYILDKDCSFISKYVTTLENRIENTKNIVQSLNKIKLDYSGKDTLYFDANRKFQYFKNEKRATSFWKKKIRYDIISKLIENDSNFSSIKANFKALEKDLKPKIIEQQVCALNALLNQNGGIDTYVKEHFLNAFVQYQDPNSSFFNNSDKSIFEKSVANNQLTFGIVTEQKNNGNIVIAYIIPGSSAFKNGNFSVNDVITSLTSKDEILETYCITNNDVEALLNASQNITFKIKKQNGIVKDITLSKTKIKVENNSIRGYLINKENPIGYIKIPSFYTDLESPNGLGVANDFAKELYKLKKENIEGLIIDLRFNGGGSMKEARDLSGLFIDRGPLSIINYKSGETYTMKDSKRGVLFSKPIVVLVNRFSASASEFFSSAMQDYNRAIIIGSQTYGKSSAQILLPLNESEELGYTKLTVEKFYRVTGKSNQKFGIIPDIKLPSLYDDFKTSESNKQYALKNDSVAVTLKHRPLKMFPIETLQANSKNRTLDNDAFLNIEKVNLILVNELINKKTQYALTLKNVSKDISAYKKIWQTFEDSNAMNKTLLNIRNSASTIEILDYNNDDKEINEKIMKELSNDIYINEAKNILFDIKNLSKLN